jgi:predicted nucleotidyltransferase
MKLPIGAADRPRKDFGRSNFPGRSRMAMTVLQPDFKEFLKLLNDHGVDYLVIGGYAVNQYGYSRPTNDIDIWIDNSPANAEKIVRAIAEFGFPPPDLATFQSDNKIFRMGNPPVRIEIHTGIDGVVYRDCRLNRAMVRLDDVDVAMIGLDDLKKNKQASGRHKDLADLDYLSLQ